MKKTIATGLVIGSLAFGAGTQVNNQFDTKGQTDIQIQVKIKEQGFQDAIYYSPTEWDNKTQADIEKEKKDRFDKWKTFVEEQSKLETPNEIIP